MAMRIGEMAKEAVAEVEVARGRAKAVDARSFELATSQILRVIYKPNVCVSQCLSIQAVSFKQVQLGNELHHNTIHYRCGEDSYVRCGCCGNPACVLFRTR